MSWKESESPANYYSVYKSSKGRFNCAFVSRNKNIQSALIGDLHLFLGPARKNLIVLKKILSKHLPFPKWQKARFGAKGKSETPGIHKNGTKLEDNALGFIPATPRSERSSSYGKQPAATPTMDSTTRSHPLNHHATMVNQQSKRNTIYDYYKTTKTSL